MRYPITNIKGDVAGYADDGRAHHESDLARGEFVTGDELDVLRGLWRAVSGSASSFEIASMAGASISMVERVEVMLFPNGTDAA